MIKFGSIAYIVVASVKLCIALGLAAALASPLRAAQQGDAQSKVVLAHYMPWFEAPPASKTWGWHWTMNSMDPEKQLGDRREIASTYYPLIGPYDSGDPDLLTYHLLTMKLAGIDGVIVDWYGLSDFRDYATLHRNATRVLEAAERLKMKFVICYEDQTVSALVEAKRITESERVSHAAKEIAWLGKYWFQSPSYLKLDGKPVLLSFGLNGLSDQEWTECLNRSQISVSYFSQQMKRSAAIGGFDWPIPSDPDGSLERFSTQASQWGNSIPVVFPRFEDYYEQAKVGKSYGKVVDEGGRRFEGLLTSAMKSKGSIVQIATWNDWGEGTMIEPSVEFGFRDLETTLRVVQQTSPAKIVATKDDLRLPLKLYRERLSKPNKNRLAQIEKAEQAIVDGRLEIARAILVTK